MHAAIVAGLPINYEKRVAAFVRRARPLPPSWKVDWVRARATQVGLSPAQLPAVRHLAMERGAHILAFSMQKSEDQRRLKEYLAPFFRFRWMSGSLLRLVHGDLNSFFTELGQVLDEEETWARSIKPTQSSSPLLLPECSFKVERGFRSPWELGSDYGGIERIHSAFEGLLRFEIGHQLARPGHARCWVDRKRRIFDHSGPRHGIPDSLERQWRFSYQLEEGFHYDVTSQTEREFDLEDETGRLHHVPKGKHINQTPHGSVR